MQWLTAFFAWLIQPIKSLVSGRRWTPSARILHILLVLLVVVALAVVQYATGLERVLRTHFLGLHLVWLPLLFLVCYALYWLIVWLWRILGPDREAGEFDDIENAWTEALRQLDAAGIDLREAPVFLVLGRPAGALEHFFAATRMPFQVRHTPDGDAPLHVYAGRQAVFVTCEGTSLLSMQAKRLLEDEPLPAPAHPAPLTDMLASGTPVPEPVAVGGLLDPIEQTSEPASLSTAQPAQNEALQTSSPGAVMLLGAPEPAVQPQARRRKAPLVRDEAVVDREARRLRHVCRLLVRDRQPYCPANGLLILLPLAATASAEDASETASVCRRDLATARAALQLDCPRFAILCDADRLPGFAELVRHFPEGGASPRWVLGQHFPLAPDVPPADVPSMIESAVEWVGDTMLPLVVGRLWVRESEPGAPDRRTVVRANAQLYEFLREGQQHLAHLARLVSRAVTGEDAGPAMLGGCYVAGTGADAQREQAFLSGVVQRAVENQNTVRWTEDALAEDADYHRYAYLGYALLVLFIIGVAVLLWTW
jgi:hypothetical protein